MQVTLFAQIVLTNQLTAPLPPLPTQSEGLTGAFASLKQTVWGFGSKAAPPTVDTSAASMISPRNCHHYT